MDVPLVKGNALVELVEVHLRRNHAVLHRQNTLDHTSDSRTSLQVADVRLDRAHNQLARVARLQTQRLVNRTHFDWVTSLGARAVALDILRALHIESKVLVHVPNQCSLCVDAGQGDTLRPTIRVDARSTDHGADWVAIALGIGELLDQNQTTTFTTAVPVTVVVKGAAVAKRREEAQIAKLDSHLRVENQVDATGNRHVGLAVAHALAGQVNGDQGRRTGRLNGHGGTVHVEEVADAVGEDLV